MSGILTSPLRLVAPGLSAKELSAHFKESRALSFVMTCPRVDAETDRRLQEVVAAMGPTFATSLRYVDPTELGFLLLEEPFVFAVLVIKHENVDAVSDVLGKVLSTSWNEPTRALEDYGYFVVGPSKTPPKKNTDLACHSFQHHPGVFYRFRYRRSVLERVPTELSAFLLRLPVECPHDAFLAPGNVRASAQELQHVSHAAHHQDHEVVAFAKASLDFTPYKSRHENVERYFLEHDRACVATEIPLWSVGELSRHPTLTGHVDILRVKDGRIEIWDYKPKAAEERMAALQVQLYCEMMSRRTGIGLDRFLAGYFDEQDAYSFEPLSFTYR